LIEREIHTRNPFERFSGVMITRIPCTGYGTVEQREKNPPETKVSHKEGSQSPGTGC
jgi:hypothetical protein